MDPPEDWNPSEEERDGFDSITCTGCTHLPQRSPICPRRGLYPIESDRNFLFFQIKNIINFFSRSYKLSLFDTLELALDFSYDFHYPVFVANRCAIRLPFIMIFTQRRSPTPGPNLWEYILWAHVFIFLLPISLNRDFQYSGRCLWPDRTLAQGGVSDSWTEPRGTLDIHPKLLSE